MEITIDPRASQWYQEEIGLPEGNGVRFVPKVYGSTPIFDGFSLGIESAQPYDIGASTRADNEILFYVEASDLWFFDGHDLHIDFDEELQEPKYIYLKSGQPVND